PPDPVAALADAAARPILALFASRDHIYFSARGAGVLRSRDGADWEPLLIGLDEPRTVQSIVEVRPSKETLTAALVEAAGGIDNIGPAPDEKTLREAVEKVAAQRPGILAGTQDGRVLRLSDAGDQWNVLARLPAEGGGIYRLVYNPAVGLAAATGSGVHLSMDGGATWQRVTTDSLTRDVALSPDPARRFTVALYGRGLAVCDPNGACETMVKSPAEIRTIVADPYGVSGFFGTDGDGVWRFDGRRVTQETTRALETSDIRDMVLAGPRLIVAAGDAGLWIRNNAESGWSPALDMPPDAVTAVAVHRGRIYAGTTRFGVLSAPLHGGRFTPVTLP
ncbi:hypothetical protein K8I61_01525, partial [bacterium]|nr:hypothetical protein [bacterium]